MPIFQRHPEVETEVEVEGELAYFGLASWWSGVFSESQREHMEDVFRPAGIPPDAKPLTTGRKQLSFHSAASLLAALAACLRNTLEDRSLALRVLSKAEERAKAEEDVIGLHLTYQALIRLHCRWRNHLPESLDLLYGACHKQIAIAPEVAQVLRERRPEEALPLHIGFQMMAIILHKDELCAKAIEICKQARFQGWSGNWTWRIGSLAKELAARGNPVPSISRSGLGPI